MVTAVHLGTGVLSWTGAERRSDRYGTVALMEDGVTSLTDGPNERPLSEEALIAIRGKPGKLVATVLDPRESTHIGDLYRGFFPSVPEKGEEIELGVGTAFFEDQEWTMAVGLFPKNAREEDWLDPEKLYRAHEQLVDLHFVPVDELPDEPIPVEPHHSMDLTIITGEDERGGYWQEKGKNR